MQNSFAVLRTISRPGKSHCDEDRAEGQSAAADATEHQRNLKRIRIDNQLIVGQGFDSTSLDDQQNSCLLYLRAGQHLYFKGRVLLRVLMGQVRIFGKILGDVENQFYPLYSLLTHSLLSIECLPLQADSSVTLQQTSDLSLLDAGLAQTVDREKLAGCSSVVQLKSLTDDGFDQLCSQYSLMRSLSDRDWISTTSSTPAAAGITSNDDICVPAGFTPIKHTFNSTEFPLVISEEWYQCAQQIFNGQAQVPAVCVYGSKNMGKSTFSRFLVNSALNQHQQIAYLDCDLGQSEFNPPGAVSLSVVDSPIFGPSYTHYRSSLISRFIGHASSEPDPGHYLSRLVDLFAYYQLHLQPRGLPLIINTQGWVTGIGYDLLIGLLQRIRPSDLVELVDKSQPPGVGKNMADIRSEGQLLERTSDAWTDLPVPIGQLQSWSPRQHFIESLTVALPKSNFSPTDNRFIALMSYFAHSGYFSSKEHRDIARQTMKWDFKPLTSMIPYFIVYGDIELQHIDLEIQRDKREVMASMNSGLVALISSGNNGGRDAAASVPGNSSNIDDDDDDDGAGNDDNLNEIFIGWAIVRAMETPRFLDKNGLYILVPSSIDPAALKSVNILRKGSIELPVNMIYQDYSIRSGPYADNTCIDGLSGQSMRKVRRNILRGWAKK